MPFAKQPDSATAPRHEKVQNAVRQNRLLSKAGLSERLFAHVFKGLVYPQIWEDPEVDMEALQIHSGHRIVTIASGGCNAMSYLTADPASVEAVDLNTAHVAFNRLKLAAVTRLPNYDAFYRFYGTADDKANLAAYERFIQPHLDGTSRAPAVTQLANGYGRVITDKALLNAEGIALLSLQTTREANILAYNDAFFLIAAISFFALVALLTHVGFRYAAGKFMAPRVTGETAQPSS